MHGDKSTIYAYAWSTIAAAKNDKSAKELLDKIEKHINIDQIDEGQKLMKEFYAQISTNSRPKIKTVW